MTTPQPYGNDNLHQFEIGADDTSFQPIDIGLVGTGTMDNAAFPPAQTLQQSHQSQQQNNTTMMNGDQEQPSGGWFQRLTSCFRIGSLQVYFDVDTNDVQERVVGSVMHANAPDYFMQDLLNKEGKKADLYGPVWITMTCAFLFAVTSNTAKYLHTDSLDDFEYDISHLTRAFYIFFFYTFALPFFLFIVFKAINVPLTLSELISLYGYSLVPYLPTTFLCLIPSVILEWLFLFCAMCLSLLLVLRNVAGPTVRSNRGWSGPVMLALICVHFIFFIVVKGSFYKHRYHEPKGGDNYADGGDNMDDGVIDSEDGGESDRW